MFWDGSRWIDERTLAAEKARRPTRRGARASLVIGAIVLALLVVSLPSSADDAAASSTPFTLMDTWGTTHAVQVMQESSKRVALRGTWYRKWSDAYLGRGAVSTRQRGAKFTVTFTGSGIAIVGPKSPGRGKARVYVNGRYVRTVSAYASRYQRQQPLFVATWSTVKTRTVTLVVAGTAGHPVFSVDAAVVRGKKSSGSRLPAPAPSPTPAPAAEPTPEPSAEPTPAAEPTPSAAPIAPPTATPMPAVTPAPTPAPTPTPTSCGTTLQGRINAAAPGSVLNLTGCTYTAGATVTKSLTILGGTVRPARGTSGLLVQANNVTIDGVVITGPQGTTYDKDEVGIEVQGTVSAPIRGLTIRNARVGTLGYGGMYIRHASGFTVENNLVQDGVYAGIMVISGRGGRIVGNTVQRIGVYGAAANGNNAYGIALTRGGGDLATDPRSADIVVSGNTVEDVPTWHAYDTHGGERITWTANVARRSRSGIFVTGSSSPSGTVRSLDNDVNGNTIYAPADADHYAITSVYSTGGYVRNNTIVGWPSGRAILTTSGGDPTATAVNLTVSGNTIR